MLSDKIIYNFLVVEDNPGDFMLIEDLLMEQFTDAVITNAINFKQASALLEAEKTPYDAILLDLVLPDKSDDQLIKLMLKKADLTPIIVLTGNSDVDYSINAISLGVSDYLVKDDLTKKMLHKSILYAINRKLILENLRTGETKLKEAQAMAKVGNWETDLSTMKVIWSDETFRIFGLNSDNFSSTHLAFLKYVHPDDRAKVDAAFVNSFGTDTISAIEHRIITANGLIKIVDERWQIFRDSLGNPIRAIGTCQDITERKIAEEQLLLSESRTRRIFESGMIGFIYWDVNGEVMDANDRFLEMTGYSKHDLHEHKLNWSKMTPPEYKEIDQIGLDQIATTGICQPFEKEYIRKDGSRIPVLLGATVFEGSNNEKGVSYIMDITEWKKAQKELRENENYLRTILDNEPECVKILNSKGELLSMNPAGVAMIEADNEQQVLGHLMKELVVDKYQEGFNKLSKDVFKGKQGSFEFEIIGLKGGHRWLETHAVPLKDAAGNVLNLLGVTRDITERKKAQTELENTTHQLRQLTDHLQTIREEERKRIAREIHDELGQQLTAIKMDLAWIDKKIPDDIKVAEEKIPIKNKLKNLISLVDGSNESVRKILNELRHGILEDNGLLDALEWQGNQFTEVAGIPVTFFTDENSLILPEQISSCLFRLYQESLTNIARHAQASKVITSIKIKNENIILIVEDDGKGFDINALQNKKSFGILGMKERVFSLHGNFQMVSTKGKGTKIEISLPLNESLNLKQTL